MTESINRPIAWMMMDENERHYLVEADPHDDDAIPLYASPAIAGPDAVPVEPATPALDVLSADGASVGPHFEPIAETPRTDAASLAMLGDAGTLNQAYQAMRDLARQLERELSAAQSQIAAQLKELTAIDDALGTNEGHSAVTHILALKDKVAALEAKLESAHLTCVLATESGLTETGRVVDKIKRDAEAKREADVRKCEALCRKESSEWEILLKIAFARNESAAHEAAAVLSSNRCADVIRAAFPDVFQGEGNER